MTTWPDRAVYGCGGDPIDDDLADELRAKQSLREAAYLEGVQAMAQSLRLILDGEPCLASNPPELAEVAQLVASSKGAKP